jgi:hypothetical protein
MHSAGIVSTLAEQLLQARARATEARAKGMDARSIEAIGRSIRQTLCCIVQIRDPREVAMKGFSLVVNPTGETVVRHGERTLPASDPYLMSLLGEAGVELVPGQIILLDAGVAKLLVEEALGAMSLEEAQLRDAKSRLLAAFIEADSLEKVDQPLTTCNSPEAA